MTHASRSALAGILTLSALAGCSGAASTPEAADEAIPAAAPEAAPPPAAEPAAEAPATAPPADACAYPPVVRESFTSSTDGATTTFVHLTPKAVGVVIALHGAGGGSRGLAEVQNEWASLFHQAVGRGYSIVIPESVERAPPRQWDVQSTGPEGDVARIDALVGELVANGAVGATSPIYVMGMSNGGGAAPIVAARLALAGRPVRAVGVYCAGASSIFAKAQYTLPTTFNLMANDTIVTDQAAIESNAKLLQARGVDAEVFVEAASAACPARFTRIPGISESDSRAIYDALVAAGTLAADGRVIGHQRGAEVEGLPAQYAPFEPVIEEQLRVLMADHSFYGDRNEATLAFFDAHR